MAKIAFVFPGQGAQAAGMGRELAEQSAAAAAVFRAADEALGFALSDLCWNGPDSELQRTEITQPAILAVSEACRAALREQLPELAPAAAAGLSLGEYPALVAAGAIGFADAIRLVRLRGRFMQEAVPEGVGAMAAILGLDEEAVSKVCAAAAAHGVVSPANLNGPGQIVISGEAGAVGVAVELAKAAGAKRAVPLAVSAPFHCALMRPAGERLAAELARVELKPGAFPVYANVDAAPATSPLRIRENLVAQVSSPVRWEACVRHMIADGVTHFVELGPGKTISAMIKKIDRDALVSGVEDARSLVETIAQLRECGL